MKHKKSDNFKTKSVSSSLVRFALNFEPEFTSDELKQVAQLSLFDWFVVSIAGQSEPVSHIVRNQITKVNTNNVFMPLSNMGANAVVLDKAFTLEIPITFSIVAFNFTNTNEIKTIPIIYSYI